MPRRRAVLAVSVFSLLTLVAAVTPVRAQTDVEDARRTAEDAADDAEGAFEIVDAAVAERAAVEQRLFEVLDRYQANAERLAETWEAFEQLSDTLAVAEARQESTRDSFETQAIAAYMDAVGSTAVIVIDSGTIESAMVAQETLGRTTRETLARLDGFLAYRNQVDEIRDATAARAEETAAVQAELDADAAELEELFAAANAEVSAAYREALEAEARLADATAALAAAQATTTTVAPPPTTTTTTAPPGTTTTTTASSTTSPTPTTTTAPPTTTTTAPESWPPIPISSATYGWRPLLETYFASDLVLDALVIIQCESVGDPNAVNPYSGASGLFQFMPGTWAVASVEAGVGDRPVFDGEANIIAASWLAEYYRSRGLDPWRPWSCRTFL
ncbi:MAG: transglycosylase SLT domain-containing protein [Acidimicrobiia bacterium]|nr:transglycosylase SLT domain-containing protein [Acidimicrobiia bacterium]